MDQIEYEIKIEYYTPRSHSMNQVEEKNSEEERRRWRYTTIMMMMKRWSNASALEYRGNDIDRSTILCV